MNFPLITGRFISHQSGIRTARLTRFTPISLTHGHLQECYPSMSMTPYRFRAACMMTGTPNVNSLFLLYHAVTLVFLFLIAWYDAKHHKIHQHFPACLPFMVSLLHSCNPCTQPVLSCVYVLLYSFLGFISGFCMFLFLSMMTGGGIGGGDIKLVGLLGILYGASGLLAVLLASCLFALLHYTICRLFQHKKWSVSLLHPICF